ncbi:hypothetical protein G3A_14290 [Bacillus sp. 17376]|nr:hypothetical protein G3A_14290 [Bacillus sp. 17376]
MVLCYPFFSLPYLQFEISFILYLFIFYQMDSNKNNRGSSLNYFGTGVRHENRSFVSKNILFRGHITSLLILALLKEKASERKQRLKDLNLY